MTAEEKLISYLEKNNLDAFYVTASVNVRYVSRYTGDDSMLLITKKGLYFITDLRYVEQAGIECPNYVIVNWRVGNNTKGDTVGFILEKNGLKSVAFEQDYVTYAEYMGLEQSVKADLVPTSGVIEEFRAVKSKEEIECSRIACDIASRAFEKIILDIRVGVTEKELASKLSHYMVMAGSDTKPYGNILISGARTSLLHGIPSAKAVEYGDFVLMDYGCQYHGYLSDMTRTVVVGKASAKQKEVYGLEQRMVENAVRTMKPGASGLEVYEASVEPIKGTEYYDYHYQGIGHGVGLFVHEQPFMGPRCKAILKPGCVITIEPGIYIPGWGGVRIEDQILITDEGNESLTTARRELLEL